MFWFCHHCTKARHLAWFCLKPWRAVSLLLQATFQEFGLWHKMGGVLYLPTTPLPLPKQLKDFFQKKLTETHGHRKPEVQFLKNTAGKQLSRILRLSIGS